MNESIVRSNFTDMATPVEVPSCIKADTLRALSIAGPYTYLITIGQKHSEGQT